VRLRGALAIAAAISTSVVACAVASGAPAKPGTATQVARLVSASAKIKTVSAAIASQLPDAAADFSWSDYPALTPDAGASCNTLTACVYGDTTSHKVMVLFGDSHALMWLPAIDPVATAKGYKLIVLWQGVCPVSDVSIWAPQFNDPAACNTWRAQMVSLINGLHPAVVVLAERTTDLFAARERYFTSAQWKAGLLTTLKQLKSSRTKVALIEDTPYFDSQVPACLAQNPSKVALCDVAYPNPQWPGFQAAEQAAAKSTGVLFVKAIPWVCTKTCSAIIGNYVPYIDSNHISFAYAQYLSGVMGDTIKNVL
jgi:hypothetical protein